jgi:catechol 2,3-dioxygenase-like lactoylglutathione lyase family enzyme
VAIRAERIEVLGIDVRNFEAAKSLFARLFGLEFREFDQFAQAAIRTVLPDSGVVHDDPRGLTPSPRRVAIDTSGFFELIESADPADADGMRNIHFKVDNIEAAIHEAQELNIRLVANLQVGGLREAIFESADLFGVRLCLVQYDEPTLVDAIVAANTSIAIS